MIKTKDIETALAERLRAQGTSASAHMIPKTLGESLPHAHIVRTGGYEKNIVIEFHNIDFDVYAQDAADAMEAACDMTDWIRGLQGDFCHAAKITTLPYANPDPRHPGLSRTTVKAQITTRVKER